MNPATSNDPKKAGAPTTSVPQGELRPTPVSREPEKPAAPGVPPEFTPGHKDFDGTALLLHYHWTGEHESLLCPWLATYGPEGLVVNTDPAAPDQRKLSHRYYVKRGNVFCEKIDLELRRMLLKPPVAPKPKGNVSDAETGQG